MSKKRSSVSGRYALLVGATSFILAVAFFWLSDIIAVKLKSLLLSFLFLVIIIVIGILADVVGTAVTIASEAPFHARGSKKIPGAQEGIYLIRNSDRVANICNDVVGDIAGTLSGAIGISLIIQAVVLWPQGSRLLMNLLMAGTIAAVTIGGKAMGKRLAVRQANKIIFLVARTLVAWKKLTRAPFSKIRRANL
jgi:Mg2+/Co2+ transporter CorB